MCTESDVSDIFEPELQSVHRFEFEVTSMNIYMQFTGPQDLARL